MRKKLKCKRMLNSAISLSGEKHISLDKEKELGCKFEAKISGPSKIIFTCVCQCKYSSKIEVKVLLGSIPN